MSNITAKNILILGATSSIAREVSLLLAQSGHRVCLAGRDITELKIISKDIELRTQTQDKIICAEFNIEDPNSHTLFLENILKLFPKLDGVFYAIGNMDKNNSSQNILQINYNYTVSILEYFADYFEKQKSGYIACITSVAGDRGRKSNYIYGSAKGGLNIYLQGLQNRLYSSNIRVIIFKLGFVDTAMTFGLPGLFLVASPEKIAKKIIKKINQNLNLTDTIYLPHFWFYIMFIIKNIPEIIFKRLSL